MTKQTFGILMGAVASAAGAWWWSRQRSQGLRQRTPVRERGTVIFDNTPTAPEVGASA